MKSVKKIIKQAFRKAGVEVSRYQPPNYEWLRQRNIRTVLDIGAHDGHFAREISDILDDIHIHSFEPVKEVFEVLKQKTSHLNMAYHNCALGESEYSTTINFSTHEQSSSILKMSSVHLENFPHAQDNGEREIEVKRLDDIFANQELKKNILVKIDVQGFEKQVIQGGKNIIQSAEVVLVEMSYQVLYEKQELFEPIYSQLLTLGFRFAGNLAQTNSSRDGSILYSDSIFIKSSLSDL